MINIYLAFLCLFHDNMYVFAIKILEQESNDDNQFSDNHRLYLENVPHHVTEDELKVMFERFGTVVDVRIHSKPGTQMLYAFITYENSKSTQASSHITQSQFHKLLGGNNEDMQVDSDEWGSGPDTSSGLLNVGNTCYVNASLQALFHIPAFVNSLLTDKVHREICDEKKSEYLQS